MRFKYAATAAVIGVALAGCQRTGYNNDYGSASPAYSPPPIQAAPVGQVQSSQLPSPTGTGSQFPAPPSANPGNGAPQQNAAIAASGLDVTKESMVGSWKVGNGGTSCDMFLTLTNLGSGSRGGTRGCVGELTTMGSWEVAGKQVVLKDRSGNQLGSVYKTADSRFTGTTASGQPITLSR
ncbi:protease inhibitor Inh/omp19 family protein [Rhizobium tumorigenes]|uniref:Outer membrane lipoprotein omp19 n=1 Tax=Rhizobium tumorigenes TaxID=2041385 RepID=A0AAF1KF12_9HYPH|nr:protease inhibitor Inh/omp19 family protein [Rhizobium tumorigenes]WFR94968.1 AprI/Inh family metalloprotease inhibitor [Rhizobium tumorigenes]